MIEVHSPRGCPKIARLAPRNMLRCTESAERRVRVRLTAMGDSGLSCAVERS